MTEPSTEIVIDFKLLFSQAKICLENKLILGECTEEDFELFDKLLDKLETLGGKYDLGDGIRISLDDVKFAK